MATSLLVGMAERLNLFATPNGGALTVGIGGDIPVFPPFFAMGTVITGNILMKMFGRKRWVPSYGFFPINSLPVRFAILLGVVSFALHMKASCDEALAAAGAEFNFTPVKGIATTGPYASSRNPMYLALCLMPLGMACLFDNAWIIATWMLLPLYLHTIVVPAEERYLQGTPALAKAYAIYSAATPRYLDFIPL